jgi:hypothetical protein
MGDSMLKGFRRGVTAVVVVALLPVGGGLAAADPNVANVPPQTKHTGAGWDMTLSLENITIESVPNMAAAPFVREGYISATARLAVDGTGNMGARTLLGVWAQVGCQFEFSDGATILAQPQITSSLPFPSLGQILTPPGSAGNDITDIALAPTVQLGPDITVKVTPGSIRNTPLASMTYPPAQEDTLKPLTEAKAFLEMFPTPDPEHPDLPNPKEQWLESLRARFADVANQNVKSGLVASAQTAHITAQVNAPGGKDNTGACGGPVAVRIYAKATMVTAGSLDTVDAYSDILSL